MEKEFGWTIQTGTAQKLDSVNVRPDYRLNASRFRAPWGMTFDNNQS
jgi:hypothetical protein